MNATLTLRSVSGFWTPQTQTAYANTDLTITLEDNGQIRNKAVLFFNGVAFLFDKSNRVVIPATKIKESNHVVVQDKNDLGNVAKEWRFIETLFFDLEKLDKNGEKQMLSEREFFKNIRADFKALTEAYEKETEKTKELAAEVVKQGKALAEIQKDIEALKNEPII